MFSFNNRGFFNQPQMPLEAPKPPAQGPSLMNVNLGGGLPNPGLSAQVQAQVPVSQTTSIWAQAGHNVPSHPNVPVSTHFPNSNPPYENNASAGISFKF